MINIQNKEFKENKISREDIFICALGYEKRSIHLLNIFSALLDQDNIFVICFADYMKYNHMNDVIVGCLKKYKNVNRKYIDGSLVLDDIIEFLKKRYHRGVAIHVDYSSMPRNWYSKLPVKLHELYKNNTYFWYVKGKYPSSYEVYPSAGIDSFNVIGRPSLRMDLKRMHVIGLGYDAIRTKALISILDPEQYSVIAAYDANFDEIKQNIYKMNLSIITQAIWKLHFYINDFSFMYSKLCELAYEYLPIGDIVFVPDGPKPLIMAMSLVPQAIDKPGVTCVHISRNKEYYEPVIVEAENDILGFSLYEQDD